MAVQVPHGCLLLQAGKQFERFTAGYVLADFHEVVVTTQTIQVIDQAAEVGRSLWRVSSTMFTHIANDHILQPLRPFMNMETMEKHSTIKAGAQVLAELTAININKTVDSDSKSTTNVLS